MDIRNRYWRMLFHLRYGLDFYTEHLRFCVNFNRYFNMLIALFTATSIASWGIWNTYSKLWGVIVAVGQVAVIVNEFLPYKGRIPQIQELKGVLSKLFDQAENQLLDFQNPDVSDDTINDKITEYLQKWGQAEEKYIKEDSLPEPEWLVKRAQKRMTRYFEFYYGGDES